MMGTYSQGPAQSKETPEGIVFGIHPVEEAIQSGRALKVHVSTKQQATKEGGPTAGQGTRSGASQNRKIGAISAEARRLRIPVEYLPPEALNRMTSGGNHQGVAASVSAYQYVPFPVLMDKLGRLAAPVVLILDGVQDPANLGGIIRSAAAMGVSGLIIPEKGAAQITASTIRVSAGGIEKLDVSRVTNLSRALEQLKANGFWSVATVIGENPSPWQVPLDGPIAIVLGGEEKGIRRLLAEKCDYRTTIPLPGGMDSLNVAAAAAVVIYEAVRQRRDSLTTGKTDEGETNAFQPRG